MAFKPTFVRTITKQGGDNYARGKNAIGICHRSGFKVPYKDLMFEPGTNYFVHKSESDGDYSLVAHPQNYPAEDVSDRIHLRWSFPDVALSLGPVVSAAGLYLVDTKVTDVGVHLDFINDQYYTRTSLGFTNQANAATFMNYHRGGVASYLGADGLIKYAGPNEPRVEYDIAGNKLGYLVETSSTNIILQSNSIGTSPWGASNIAVQTNAALAPDGTTTASRLVAVSTGTSVGHPISQAITTVLSNAYTYSFMAKPDGVDSLLIQMKNGPGTNSFEAIVDITAIPSVVASYKVGTGVNVRTSVIPMLDGWILIRGTGFFGALDTSNTISIFPLNTNREPIYVANSVAGFYLWGVQVEQQKYATSYIPTTNAVAGRTKDRARVLLDSSLYSSPEGSLRIEYSRSATSVTNTNQFLLHISDFSYTNNVAVGEQNGREGLSVNQNGTFNGNATVSVKVPQDTLVKVAGSWEDNNVVFVRNGVEKVVDAIASVPTVVLSSFQIGSDHNGFNNSTRAHIRKIDYWPYPQTSTALRSLTV